MRSRLARRLGLAGSLLPADTTLTAAARSTRAITALDEMPIFALTRQARMNWPAPSAMLSPTTAQEGAAASANVEKVGKVRSAKAMMLKRDTIIVIINLDCWKEGRVWAE